MTEPILNDSNLLQFHIFHDPYPRDITQTEVAGHRNEQSKKAETRPLFFKDLYAAYTLYCTIVNFTPRVLE